MGDLASRFPQLNVFGGCCGTDWDHLEQIVKNVMSVKSLQTV